MASGETTEETKDEEKEAKDNDTSAEGVVRRRVNLLKVYACRRSQPTSDSAGATFLMEMIFENIHRQKDEETKSGSEEKGAEETKEGGPRGAPKNSTLYLTFKCDDSSQLASFVQRLNLNRLCKGQGATRGKTDL